MSTKPNISFSSVYFPHTVTILSLSTVQMQYKSAVLKMARKICHEPPRGSKLISILRYISCNGCGAHISTPSKLTERHTSTYGYQDFGIYHRPSIEAARRAPWYDELANVTLCSSIKDSCGRQANYQSSEDWGDDIMLIQGPFRYFFLFVWRWSMCVSPPGDDFQFNTE